MKNYIYILFLLLLSGCNKSEEYLFDQSPDDRMKEKLTEVKNQLLSAENGWVVYNQTLSKGLYGYYMEFDENERVRMMADINSGTANTLKESIYSLRVVSTPVLSFETYNYINLLNDPNASVVGGVRGDGLKSDIEFELVRNTADSIIFKGRRYNTEMVLIRATEEQRRAYFDKKYLPIIDRAKKFFVDTKIPFFEIDNIKYQIELNPSIKKVVISSLVDGKVQSSSNEFYFNLTGISIPKGIRIGNELIVAFKFDGEKLSAISSSGNNYDISDSPNPILPIHNVIGVLYKNFRSDFKKYNPGTSPKGLEILQRYHENLENRTTGYAFNSGYLNLSWDIINRRVTLSGFTSQNAGVSGWTTNIVYDYTFNESSKVYQFKVRTEASGGYSALIMDKMNDFLIKNDNIKLEYFIDNGVTYAQMIGGNNDEIKITFNLQ